MKAEKLSLFGVALLWVTGGYALPAAEAPAAVAAHPTYPTTITSVWSATGTQITPYNPILPVDYYSKTVISTVTVTILEPWAAAPTSFPYTLRQTAISHRTEETRLLKTLTAPLVTSVSSSVVTGTSTWVLWPPSATYLAAGAQLPPPGVRAAGLDLRPSM